MKTNIELVSKQLQGRGVNFRLEEGRIIWEGETSNGWWSTMIDTGESDCVMTIVARLPLRVPSERRTAFALELTHLNCGRRMGTWQLNLETGGVLFCASFFTPGLMKEELEDMMWLAVGLVIAAADEMMGRLANAAFGGRDGAEGQQIPGAISNPARVEFN